MDATGARGRAGEVRRLLTDSSYGGHENSVPSRAAQTSSAILFTTSLSTTSRRRRFRGQTQSRSRSAFESTVPVSVTTDPTVSTPIVLAFLQCRAPSSTYCRQGAFVSASSFAAARAFSEASTRSGASFTRRSTLTPLEVIGLSVAIARPVVVGEDTHDDDDRQHQDASMKRMDSTPGCAAGPWPPRMGQFLAVRAVSPVEPSCA